MTFDHVVLRENLTFVAKILDCHHETFLSGFVYVKNV